MPHVRAGEPIATRWTPEIKAEVKRSRVAVTSQLAEAINACPEAQRPQVLVNSSAVGYYGNSEVSCKWGRHAGWQLYAWKLSRVGLGDGGGMGTGAEGGCGVS